MEAAAASSASSAPAAAAAPASAASGSATDTSASSAGRRRARRRRSAGKRKRSGNGTGTGTSSGNDGTSSGGGSRARPLTVNDDSYSDGASDEAQAVAVPAKKAEKQKRKQKKKKAAQKKEEEGDQEEVEAESKPPAQWGCPACTFLNEPTRSFCEMCGTTNPRPPAAAAASSSGRAALFDVLSGGGAGEWNCRACTMKNAPRSRVCALCGSLNPNPIVPTGVLSIMRGGRAAAIDSGDSNDSDDEGDSSEGGPDSSSSGSSDEEAGHEWECDNCEVSGQIPPSAKRCPTCCAPRPRSVTLKRPKKSSKNAEAERRRKRRKKSKAQDEDAKSAYGVSSAALRKLTKNPQLNDKLADALQTLTHTLAMMDASADSEWGDIHGASLFLRGPSALLSRSTRKDPELLPVLMEISKQETRHYARETRLLAIQSINYVVKLERDLLSRTVTNDIVGMYLDALSTWVKESQDLAAQTDVRTAQMIVEECVNGISSMSNFEPSAIREMSGPAKFADYLDFLDVILSDESAASAGFHPSVLMTALEILQRCCMKMRWDRATTVDSTPPRESSASIIDKRGKPPCTIDLEGAKTLVAILWRALAHKHIQLHMKAAKCLLMLFHRAPHGHPAIIHELVPAALLREFVRIAVDSSAEESDESRLAVISLLVNLFDTRHELVTLFLQDNIYDEFFKGLVPLLTTSSSSISKHALKLANLLSRVVCRRHSAKNHANAKTHFNEAQTSDADEEEARTSPRRRARFNSLPDPNVLTTILLDFVEADSIPAVSTVLKEGADLNFPRTVDIHGKEIDKPLHVAAEYASLSMVRFLVKRGADINLDGANGTALHVAARAGRCDVMSFLLQCGAHLDATDRNGKTVSDIVEEMERDASSSPTEDGQWSPVKKLLEVYRKSSSLRDDSDLSEADDFSGRGRSWRFSSGNGLAFDDGDDDEDIDDIDTDDDEDTGEFYGDYDDDEDDEEDEMFSSGHHADGDLEGGFHSDDSSSEDDGDRDEDPKAVLEDDKSGSSKRRSDAAPSSHGSTPRDDQHTDDRSASASDTFEQENPVREEKDSVTSPGQMDAFASAVLQCLLTVLRSVDLQNVERSVLSTLASVLEMAPSRAIRRLPDGDILVLLDTVHFLLQAEHKLPASTGDVSLSASSSPIGRGENSTRKGLSAKQKTDLASHILALRILLAVARKSHADSSIFYQIERRGIGEQIEDLHLTSSRWMNSLRDGEQFGGTRQTIFERGVLLLRSLRADMMECGMLHLHRLKNLARRLKSFTSDVSKEEKALALVDFVELFEHANSITSYEFKQSKLLPAIVHFLTPGGTLDEERAQSLIRALERCPGSLNHFVSRLQSIANQEESFPVLSFCSSKGSELYPLTRQLKITFSRANQVGAAAGANAAVDSLKNPRESVRAIQTSPLTHFQSLERTVFRALPARDQRLSQFYLSLVGYMIQKIVDGKWRKYLVLGYDPVRSYHLLKPEGGGGDQELVEMVLHDSQCKLLGPVEVFDEPTVDFEIFGPLANGSGTSTPKSGKKRKKSNNKKKQQGAGTVDEEYGIPIEVKNTAAIAVGKLKGAWYAGVLQSTSAGEGVAKSSKSFDDVVHPNITYTVKMVSGSKTVRNVPAECLRPRMARPQVGSVVEVDGALGEVTRVYDEEDEAGTDPLWDIKVSTEIEKMRVTKDRTQFPPPTTSMSKALEDDGLIEAMSIRRLFPGKESSAIVGRIGDRVWVLPRSTSSVKDISIPGVIKRFPSGLESIRESTTVVVEVSFASLSPVSIKVEQDRLLNFALGGPQGSNPSRLLAALQSHVRSGAGFLSDQNRSQSLREAFEQIASARGLHSSHDGIASSASSLSRLQSLLSSHSSNESSERAGLGTDSSPPGADSLISAVSSSSASPSGSSSRAKVYRSDAVLEHIKHGGDNVAWTCNAFPRVKLLIGLREKRDNGFQSSTSALWQAIRESEHDADEETKPALPRPVALLLDADPSTHGCVPKARVRTVWADVFNRFDSSASTAQTSRRKKRKLQPPAATTPMTPSTPWNFDKFIAFMRVVFEPAKRSSTQQNSATIKHCVMFSKFATVESRRSLLTSDGFIASMASLCRDVTKAMLMVKYLRSRGYGSQLSEKRAKAEENSESEVTESQEADSGSFTTSQAKTAHKKRPKSVELLNFLPDENVLKCLETLREANSSGYSSMGMLQDAEAVVPPWKVPFDLQCDFKVEWGGSPKSALASSLILPSPTSAQEIQHRSNSAISSSREDLSWLQQLNGTLPSTDDSSNASALSDSVTDSIRLLRYLFEFRTSVVAHNSPSSGVIDEDLWASPRLYNKLEAQLQDVLSVCSGIYPKWYDIMITNCKFFFPRRLREQLFRATSFGCTRSLHWFRNQLALDESGSDQLPVRDMGGIYNQDISISPIPKERVKVNRANLLSSAETVMKMHAKRKAILDVVFVGEKGYGSGVTAAFYSATAHALQSVRENVQPATRCWVPGDEDEADVSQDESDSNIGLGMEDVPVVRHANGLFPFPHAKVPPRVVDRFRMIGRLAGKALMDDRLLPLPLSTQFMRLVVGETLPVEAVRDIFGTHGRIIYSMYTASRGLTAVQTTESARPVEIDGMGVAEWLATVDMSFLEPLSQQPLRIGGADSAVTVENMSEYVDLVLDRWLRSGIAPQVAAFREGINDVLPLSKLRLLFVPELLEMLCGNDDVEWDSASLLRSMKLAHGYTRDSQPVQYFARALEEMPPAARRAFLLYATGCPNLPPGGFSALKPQFEVVRRVVDADVDVDRALPFARTCTNTLHLPAYSSQDVLASQLAFAVANSRGVIDRD